MVEFLAKKIVFLVFVQVSFAVCPNHDKLLSFKISNVDESCKNHFNSFLNALKNEDHWAVKSEFQLIGKSL
jgi:hypothetical protein